MSETIIKVENIAKSYILRHQQAEKYTALRDVITHKVKSIFSSAKETDAFRSREEFWALKDISFDVKKGDRIGIIGRNGAGKSTLLKILSRIVEPTKGKISMNGRVASLLEVGTGFHPELTGRENIFLNGSILGMGKREIRQKFDEIVDFAGVEKFLDTPVKRYSSGMYVRLAFAVAAHLEPEILIVDEVLAVGDAEFQNKCLGKMDEVSKSEGRTVLFVSHNMGAINALCNSAILLDKGQIRSMGKTETITGMYFSGSYAEAGEFIIGKSSNDEKVIIEKVTLRDAMNRPQHTFQFGDNIQVEIELDALQEFEKPYLWIGIKNGRGPVTAATAMIDGFRPAKFSKGHNTVKCTFLNVPFMPGQYTIHMGIRAADGLSLISDSKDVAIFSISTILSEIGLNGGLADTLASDSVSPLIPYIWEFEGDQKYSFDIKNYVK
ncbi:MAG: ABC transporter ATP-binding protein [Bacteroidetes bacterium]|nr:MAG: ABC transporter ATP-binding protein [Bacteroidota bacterium]